MDRLSAQLQAVHFEHLVWNKEHKVDYTVFKKNSLRLNVYISEDQSEGNIFRTYGIESLPCPHSANRAAGLAQLKTVLNKNICLQLNIIFLFELIVWKCSHIVMS